MRPEDLKKAKQDVTARADEVLDQLYRAILALPVFTLKDGSKATVEPLAEPERAADGELQCGFDVRLADGSLLEFTVQNTGWEKSLAAAFGRKPKSGPPQR